MVTEAGEMRRLRLQGILSGSEMECCLSGCARKERGCEVLKTLGEMLGRCCGGIMSMFGPYSGGSLRKAWMMSEMITVKGCFGTYLR